MDLHHQISIPWTICLHININLSKTQDFEQNKGLVSQVNIQNCFLNLERLFLEYRIGLLHLSKKTSVQMTEGITN